MLEVSVASCYCAATTCTKSILHGADVMNAVACGFGGVLLGVMVGSLYDC